MTAIVNYPTGSSTKLFTPAFSEPLAIIAIKIFLIAVLVFSSIAITAISLVSIYNFTDLTNKKEPMEPLPPTERLREDQFGTLQNLEKKLGEQVIGQDNCLEEVCNAIKASFLGLGDPGRPRSVIFLLGPTGVGKTKLSAALPEALKEIAPFNFLCFNMSDFKEPHSIARFTGPPPGYIGHKEGGQLSEAIKANPQSVILFDEIEKAHPNVFDVLLAVTGQGEIYDSKGKKIDFTRSIVIMTSNLGANIAAVHTTLKKFGPKLDELINSVHFVKAELGDPLLTPEKKKSLEENTVSKISSLLDVELTQPDMTSAESFKEDLIYAIMRRNVQNAIGQNFRPEFINRFDKIIICRPITRRYMFNLVNLEVAEFNKRLKIYDISLSLDDKAIEFLISKGFDLAMGARALKRSIENHLVAKITDMILSKNALLVKAEKKKEILLKCSEEGGNLTFSRETAPVD